MVDLLTLEDVTHQPTTWLGLASNLVVPITYNDILKAMQEQGVPKGLAMGTLAFFGMGLQTYSQQRRRLPPPRWRFDMPLY
jgi:hypothetical protein